MLNRRRSPIQDEYIERYLREKKLDLTATLDEKKAYHIAASTNYNSAMRSFDTFCDQSSHRI